MSPDAEKGWSSNTDTPLPHETRHEEPVAEVPLESVGTEKELNDGKTVDTESIEETESQDDIDKEKNNAHWGLKRTQTNTTTATSIVTTEPSEVDPTEPRKRTWSEKLNPLKSKHLPPVPEKRKVSREQQAGFFSMLTFQWIAPIMSVGYQRPLEANDVWYVNPDREVGVLSDKLRTHLAIRKEAGAKRPLMMALYDTFKREFIIGGVCQLTAALCQCMSPFTMKYLIKFAAQAYYAEQYGGPSPHIANGIGLVLGITCMQVIQSLCTNHFIYRGMMVGGQCRAVLIAVIFDKAMTISGRARAGGTPKDQKEKVPEDIKPGSTEEKSWFKKKLGKDKKPKGKTPASADGQGWSNGRIVNLMSTDTYRIDQASGMFHICWTSPIQVVLVLALLLINLTYSALAGFGFICIMMPLLGKSIGSLMARRKVINKITDQRVTLTQEILSSVRFVKYFGWETAFLDRLDKVRNSEISKISFLLSIRNGIMAVSMTTPIFASMLSFITLQVSRWAESPESSSDLLVFGAVQLTADSAQSYLPIGHRPGRGCFGFYHPYPGVPRMLKKSQDEATWNHRRRQDAIVSQQMRISHGSGPRLRKRT